MNATKIKHIPKITVIVPIYNDELYLYDALESIRRQIFTDFECICVNDGSTDKSEAIIDDFVKSDKRFLKVNKKNGGVSSARNAGLDIASGEYVFFMDHDDLIPSYTLEKLFSAVEKFNADMSRGRVMMVKENFTLDELPSDKTPEKQRYFDNPLFDLRWRTITRYKRWCWIWLCLFKRETIASIRFVEELRAGGEDNLFMFEVVRRIKDYVQIDSIVACHRKATTSVTLGGKLHPALVTMYGTIIPYVHQNYTLDHTVDKRLLSWVYNWAARNSFRFLIRKPIHSYDSELLETARKILVRYYRSPEFHEIYRRWGARRRIFFHLFIRGKYAILRKLKVLL